MCLIFLVEFPKHFPIAYNIDPKKHGYFVLIIPTYIEVKLVYMSKIFVQGGMRVYVCVNDTSPPGFLLPLIEMNACLVKYLQCKVAYLVPLHSEAKCDMFYMNLLQIYSAAKRTFYVKSCKIED